MRNNRRHGGQLLIDQLALNGCDTVFCVPGESYLAALDGLADNQVVRTIICRQEGGAAIMAEAYGKMTGRPGIAFVTRGPGATNASPGVHIAMQDSTPMILCIGQVERAALDREAFQEVDYRAMFGPLAKWVGQVESTDRIPEYVSRAMHEACSGRPGPVVLSFPEDVLSAQTDASDALPALQVSPKACAADANALIGAVDSAERPLLIVGGGAWNQTAATDLRQFAENNNLPVVASIRCQDYLDNDSQAYIGDLGVGVNPALAQRVKDADLIVSIGARLGELTTSGYTLLDIPSPKQRLVHSHPSSSELGRVYRPEIAINASSPSLLACLASRDCSNKSRWQTWTKDARSDFDAWQVPQATPGKLHMAQVVEHVRDVLPADAIIANGAGNYTAWVHRYYRFHNFRTQLAPTSGSMGYGLPAAIAGKLARPESPVICFAGDGCYMMHGQELATALQYELPIVIIIANNGMYGTIRMHQEKHYPGRVNGTTLVNPDFAALAKAYGAHGELVEADADFPAAFHRALDAKRPALIELRLDPEALTPRATLSETRAQGESMQTSSS